jgi:hypothetical protein
MPNSWRSLARYFEKPTAFNPQQAQFFYGFPVFGKHGWTGHAGRFESVQENVTQIMTKVDIRLG